MKISLGFSTCPNDTFMFDAMVHGRVNTEGLEFDLVMEDILHLNRRAIAGELDVLKVSYNAYGHVRDRYRLLRSGSAMGKGCGPLLIAAEPYTIDQLRALNPKIAIPGVNTTANLLMSFFAPDLVNKEEMLFHEVMAAVAMGENEAGVIIHENRFTYQERGLYCVQDLGAYWEEQTGLPIPLGAICAREDLGEDLINKIERVLRRSVEYAFAHPKESKAFIQLYAQELSEEVTRAHIDLYVNEYSVDMGEEGRAAVEKLLKVGEEMGLYA